MHIIGPLENVRHVSEHCRFIRTEMALSLNGYSNLTGFKNFPSTSRNLLNCRSGENKFRVAGANLCFEIFLPKVVRTRGGGRHPRQNY